MSSQAPLIVSELDAYAVNFKVLFEILRSALCEWLGKFSHWKGFEWSSSVRSEGKYVHGNTDQK